MTRIRTTIAALTLLTATAITGCVYPSGCARIADHGQPGWTYDGPTHTWWNANGFVGWSTAEDSPIWQDTYRCAETNGAHR